MNSVSNKRDALKEAASFLKFSITLSSGALVFSADIINMDVVLQPYTKWLLTVSWILLGLSVAAGVISFSRIPVMLSKEDYNLEDKYLIWPGRIHQAFFALGILCLGISLSVLLFSATIDESDVESVTSVERSHLTAPLLQGFTKYVDL